ncbi:MAG: molecular chaperone HtpG [Thermoanaerobaculia bacterium]|nr:molecular chaperone HtpG [Thermoanaerobaculia bacterium]
MLLKRGSKPSIAIFIVVSLALVADAWLDSVCSTARPRCSWPTVIVELTTAGSARVVRPRCVLPQHPLQLTLPSFSRGVELGAYADQVQRLSLFQALSARQTGDAVKLAGMVLDVADIAGPLLSRVPMTFKQYTEHDLGHSVNLIRLMGEFVPEATRTKLSDIEVAVLMLSAILHDFGMYVEPEEKETFLASDQYKAFLAASPERQHAIESSVRPTVVRAIEDAALADYFRKHHPKRAATNIDRFFAGKLVFDGFDLAPDVKRICESHGWPVFESYEANPDQTIARGLKTRAPVNGAPFNQQYIACCLRLADIMDFDRSRTPVSILRTITDDRSQAEWQKHMQIRGWEIGERVVEYHASCKHPEHYVAVMEFLDAIDDELTKCRRLVVRDAPRDIADKYALHLPAAVDRMPVEMEDKSYIAGGFRFELEYERILKLLMDKSLYPDPSLFLRELLQNALDACRYRKAIAQLEGAGDQYEPHIVVWDKSHEPTATIVFQDNGIGMSEDVIKNYFMRVGRSFYRSGEFNAQRQRLAAQGIQLEATSQFGIGILSCFMVADRIEIESYRLNERPLSITIEGPTKYFVIQRLAPPKVRQVQTVAARAEDDGPPQYAGTRITVHLRPDVSVDVAGAMKSFSSNLECDVAVVAPQRRQIFEAWRWERDAITIRTRQVTVAHREASAEPHALHMNRRDIQLLDRLLVASEVPIREFELRGRAWFWFLRSTSNKPAVRRGYLHLTTDLRCVGPAAAMAEFSYEKELWYELESLIDREITAEELPKLAGESEYGKEYDWDWLAQYWNQASREKRERILKWRGADNSWVRLKNLLTLAGGTDEWLDDQIVAPYYERIEVSGPKAYALHGIELPAGILRWDAMTGTAGRVDFLPGTAAFHVDDRRPSSPTPAANRLFVDPNEGRKIAIPLLRAFLKEAATLTAVHGGDDGWQEWFTAFVSAARDRPYWNEAIEGLESELRRRIADAKRH